MAKTKTKRKPKTTKKRPAKKSAAQTRAATKRAAKAAPKKPAPKPAPAPKPVPKEPPMAKRKSSPKPTTSSSVTVRSTSAPSRFSARRAPGKKRSLLSRVAIAAAAGMATAFGLYYADKLPYVGPWMRGGSDDPATPYVPIRAALVYALLGGGATYLTYKVTKDVTAAAGPAGVTASMTGIEFYRHFTSPDEEETEGLGRLGNATPYGAGGTNAGYASAVPPGKTVANLPGYRLKDVMFVTDADGNTFEVRPARPGSGSLAVDCRDAAGRPVPCPSSSTSTGACDCPPGNSCKKPCAPRVPGCFTGSPPPPSKECNVWKGPAAYC